MTLLGSVAYDPAAAASVVLTSATAMTAFDTAHARVTFTAPASGYVAVRGRANFSGATSAPEVLLGVLESSTVICRMPCLPNGAGITSAAGDQRGREFYCIVPGVGAGSHSWDFAYGVEVVSGAGGVFEWGGPNDASGADAWGALNFEVYDPGVNLLGAKLYDPSTAATKATSLRAMAAVDTTNLRLTVTAPASGNIFWRIRCVVTGASTSPAPSILLGVMESSTVVARQAPCVTDSSGSSATFPYIVHDASGVMTGVSAGSHTYDAAWAVQKAGGSVNYLIKYGGPNNTTADDAWGAFLFELWAA